MQLILSLMLARSPLALSTTDASSFPVDIVLNGFQHQSSDAISNRYPRDRRWNFCCSACGAGCIVLRRLSSASLLLPCTTRVDLDKCHCRRSDFDRLRANLRRTLLDGLSHLDAAFAAPVRMGTGFIWHVHRGVWRDSCHGNAYSMETLLSSGGGRESALCRSIGSCRHIFP